MLDPSKIIALLLAFFLGFASFGGVVVIALSTATINDIESSGIKVLPDEYFGDDPDVDITKLSLLGFYQEMQDLSGFGDAVTLGFLEKRYDIRLPEILDNFLYDQTKNLHISKLFSEEGIHLVLSTVYIGYIEKFECHKIDSTEHGDPSDKENSRWYNPNNGTYISGIDETIAYFTLEDFLTGNIDTDAVLHEIVLADVLGYTYNEETDEWYDSNGVLVDGIMSVFADCTLDNVDDRIHTAEIGKFVGFHKNADGTWCEYDEHGIEQDIHPFMASIANRTLDSLGGVFDSMTIADLIPEEDRTSGVFAIIPPETKLDSIGEAVNNSTSNSPLQFFMNDSIITFEDEQRDTLDALCRSQGETITLSVDDPEAIKYFINSDCWPKDAEGNPESTCDVPLWRTQPLSNSFSYIVKILTDISVVGPGLGL